MQNTVGNEMNLMNNSKTLGEYVHHIADFETKALTLSKTAKEIKKEADNRLSNAQNNTYSCRQKLEVCKRKLNSDQEDLNQLSDEQYVNNKVSTEVEEKITSTISKEKVENEKTKLSASETGCAMGCLVFVVGIVVSIIVAIVSIVNPSADTGILITIGAVIALIVAVVGVVLYGILNNMTSKPKDLRVEYEQEIRKKYADKKTAKQNLVRDDLRQLDMQKKAYETAENKEEDCRKQREEAYRVAAECDNAAIEIHKHVERVHKETGVIPPDYRSLDCLVELDRIFQNDLADTMREAVKIYDERVFRGEVIRGIDKISSQLGQLNSSMEYMQRTLSAINSNVSMMSQDVFRVSQSMDNISGTQDRIFEQAQATRYAAESLKKSQETCEEYLKKYRK